MGSLGSPLQSQVSSRRPYPATTPGERSPDQHLAPTEQKSYSVTASGSGATQAVLQVTGLSPTLTLAVRSASVDATGGIVTLSTGIASIKMLGGTIIAVSEWEIVLRHRSR